MTELWNYVLKDLHYTVCCFEDIFEKCLSVKKKQYFWSWFIQMKMYKNHWPKSSCEYCRSPLKLHCTHHLMNFGPLLKPLGFVFRLSSQFHPFLSIVTLRGQSKMLQTRPSASPCKTAFALLLGRKRFLCNLEFCGWIRCHTANAVVGWVYCRRSLHFWLILHWAVAHLRRRRCSPYPPDTISSWRYEPLYFGSRPFTGQTTVWNHASRSTQPIPSVPVRICLRLQLPSPSPMQIELPLNCTPAPLRVLQPAIRLFKMNTWSHHWLAKRRGAWYKHGRTVPSSNLSFSARSSKRTFLSATF